MATARSYYALVAGASFCLGAGMELFMIKTGFYEKVTMIEAEERQTQRERLLSQRGGPGRVE